MTREGQSGTQGQTRASHVRGRHRQTKGQEGSHTDSLTLPALVGSRGGPPAPQPGVGALTIHVTAQHGFIQGVHTALLQPLLGWGCVQADEVLGLTGPTCVTPRPPSPPFGGSAYLLPTSRYEESGGPYLPEGGIGGAFQGPAMAMEQLSSILDGFGDSVPFTKEAYA